MEKKGSDKVLSIYWFAILALVAAGVFVMVYTFYNSFYDIRDIETNLMVNKISECISRQGRIDSEFLKNLESTKTDTETCTDAGDCQKKIGINLVNTANNLKANIGIENIDESIKSEGVAENLQCLALQIALQESSLQHCNELKDEKNNPLYCDGDANNVKATISPKEDSLGVMQINTKVHNVKAEFFKDNVEYALKNVLIEGYNNYKNGRIFTPTGKEYSGWQAALRAYNGWGENGNKNYVEEVIAKKEAIKALFPEYCSENLKQETGVNLIGKCNLNFGSEKGNDEYYLEVNFYDFDSGRLTASSDEGNKNLKADCEIQKDKEHKKLSKCTEKSFYAVDEDNFKYKVKILSVIRKIEQNVK